MLTHFQAVEFHSITLCNVGPPRVAESGCSLAREHPLSLICAECGTRTRKPFRADVFETSVYAIPPTRQGCSAAVYRVTQWARP